MQTRFPILSFFVFLSPTVVFAHVGHGTFNGVDLWHYLTSPLHLISILVIVAVVVFGVRYLKKRKQVN